MHNTVMFIALGRGAVYRKSDGTKEAGHFFW